MTAPFVNDYPVSALSARMFWDTPIAHIEGHGHRHFIVERVMRYGRLQDWELIKAWYGFEGLREIVTALRDLDEVSIAYLCAILDLKQEDFKCYTRRQSLPSFLSY
jgi:hypothetical protein